MIQSVTEKKAREVIFHQLRQRIVTSPYFREHYPPASHIQSELRFPNNVWIRPVAGNDVAIISENVFCGYIDECVAGDTLVSVPGGEVSIEELSRIGEANIVSVDISTGLYHTVHARIKPATIAETFDVVLDSGQNIRATGNHPVLVRSGVAWCWVEISDLKIGDEVFTDGRKGLACVESSNGREGCVEPFLRSETFEGDAGQDAIGVEKASTDLRGNASQDASCASREENSFCGVQTSVVGAKQNSRVSTYRGEQREDFSCECMVPKAREMEVSRLRTDSKRRQSGISLQLGSTGDGSAGCRSSRGVIQRGENSRSVLRFERAKAVVPPGFFACRSGRDYIDGGEAERIYIRQKAESEVGRHVGIRKSARVAVRDLDRTYSVARVVSILPGGREQTYDLSAPSFQNFIANGIVVHNTNFMAVIERSKRMYALDAKGHYDQAEENFNAFLGRMRGRFMQRDGSMPGRLIISSSARYPNDFTERKEEEAQKEIAAGEPRTIYSLRYATWETQPKYDDSPSFRVMSGGITAKPRILEDGETPEIIVGKMIKVPNAFRKRFEEDIYRALREDAGLSTRAIEPFILRRDCMRIAVDAGAMFGLQHPFNLECGEATKIRIIQEKVRKHDFICALHIDLARTRDRIGLACFHVEGVRNVWREEGDGPARLIVAPYIVCDFLLQITHPPNDETIFGDIRGIIDDAINAGYKIRFATVDAYQCVAGDSIVWTARGMIPARDVMKGDVVQSHVGPRRVVQRWAFGRRPVVRIVTNDGHEISATAKHRFEVASGWRWLTVGGIQVKTPQWGWKAVEDLCIGDVIRIWDRRAEVGAGEYVALKACLHGVNGRRDVSPPDFLTPELAEWIGIFHGDGSIDGDAVHIACHPDEIDDAADITKTAIGRPPSIRRDGNRGRVSISSRGLLRWIEDNALGKDHAVPNAIRISPPDVQAAFLRGLFSTDGNVSKRDGGCSLSSSNVEVVRYAQDFLRMAYGIQTRITKIRRILGESYPTTKEFQYVLGVRGGRRLFAEMIGFCYEKKRRSLESHFGVKGRQFLSKIAEIHSGDADVYDFDVDGDPSYVVNGFVSHNSTDMRQTLRRHFKLITGEVSMDRTTIPYNDFKNTLYEERLATYHHPVLVSEVADLEYNPSTGKVDHPPGGSKDLADAAAGSIHVLTRRRDVWAAFGGRPQIVRQQPERAGGVWR